MKHSVSTPAPAPAPLLATAKPSSFYRGDLWRAGQAAAKVLPGPVCRALARMLGTAYFLSNGRRRLVVIQNLLPGVAGDRARASALARELFANFGEKLIDLWRYESGLPINSLVRDARGWDHFQAAKQQGRGVLLITPHLGNWEFGAPVLAERGVQVLVITLQEPDTRLTEMRKASRARWGIETLVLGPDPFAFVEVIRRLENGATVALLVDRPAPDTGTIVQLFGRSFAASVAPAELARATGCVLLPVCLPRVGNGYRAEVLPAITYTRESLRAPAARAQLTQEMMRAFEPKIQQYLAQWYHFVPIWPTT